MSKLIDLTGQRFGRLVVVERAENHIQANGCRKTQWLCQCDCGNHVVVQGANLKNGHVKSCGCYQRDNPSHKKHGKRATRLYMIWKHIRQRCLDENCKSYARYGGRGIKLCEEWLNSFNTFYDWAMANGYRDDLTIDRINVNGNYCPENCRWATRKTQGNNKRNNHNIAYKGKTQTLSQWCEELGLSYSSIWNRLYILGWATEKAFETP